MELDSDHLRGRQVIVIVGGAFAFINSERILSDCPYVDHEVFAV